jgi:hypothetical protein
MYSDAALLLEITSTEDENAQAIKKRTNKQLIRFMLASFPTKPTAQFRRVALLLCSLQISESSIRKLRARELAAWAKKQRILVEFDLRQAIRVRLGIRIAWVFDLVVRIHGRFKRSHRILRMRAIASCAEPVPSGRAAEAR